MNESVELPILDSDEPGGFGKTASPPRRPSGAAARLATLGRCGLLFLLALGIRYAASIDEAETSRSGQSLTLAEVQFVVPQATTIGPLTSAGLQEVQDEDGNTVALALQTLPASAKIIGYRGPSNVLLVLNEELTVERCELLSSADTPEHVAAVREDAGFFNQFEGWTLGEVESFSSVEATTGATLTALAIAESVAVRLGADKPSLRFSEELQNADLELAFDEPEQLQLRPVRPGLADVYSADQQQIVARLLRTGVWSDSIAGYQGPSELLVVLDTDNIVQRIRLRNTFDNQPYAGYLNEDDYFWKTFLDTEFSQLRQLNLEEAQVEGISGATMTSLAAAETLIEAAEEFYQQQTQPAGDRASTNSSVHWTTHDLGTVVVLAIGLLIGLTRLRGLRTLRWIWWLVLIGYFGLVTGNLISLVVISGWTINGVAWQLAPGLTLVLLVSLLVPATTRRNIYCSHLCPHGAVQQLLKPGGRRKRRLPKRFHRWLRQLPGLLLFAATILVVLSFDVNLASWEPFNAWVWYVSGWASLVLAGVSLISSAFLPMAWCRYGCATGRLLEYVRHSAQAAKWQIADVALIVLVVLAWLPLLWSDAAW